MKLRHSLTALALLASSVPAAGLTLEELAARLEKLESKVNAYEKKYGPLEKSNSGSPSQLSGRVNPVSIPTPVPSPRASSGIATDDDIDAAFLRESGSGGGAGGWWEKTTIGGYGELHLNQGDKEQIDFHRWVLFINHKFNDRIKLFSEFELEHSLVQDTADGSNGGEVELEQAYIEFDWENGLTTKVGQFLIPVGILNEVHEPDTFFGVERNSIEADIIPATWWEGGVGLTKNYDNGLGFDVAVHSGLQVDPANGDIRSGRQKVAQFDDPDVATTVRVRYNGINGLQLSGFAQYQNDISAGLGGDDSATLVGATAVYQNGGFGLRALAARWDISGAGFEANNTDEQYGYYIEPSYTWTLGGDQRLGVFGRYSSSEFGEGGGLKEIDEYRVGFNYWPTSNVVLKVDYTINDTDGQEATETYNFGVGYSF